MYGPCGTYFGAFHVDATRLSEDDYIEVRCRNGRCRRDGYVTYHKWFFGNEGGCSTRQEPKQYADPLEAVTLMKGQSHGYR